MSLRPPHLGESGSEASADSRFVEALEGTHTAAGPAASHGAPGAGAVAAWRSIASSLPFELPNGYRTEICTRVAPWIASLADCLESGALLLFDYGLPRTHYYHPQRTDGTLRCHFKQRAHDDPFINVGVQDITAWVDFTRVAEAPMKQRFR
ncbi:MAG: SAM-dependent methyltransferase [Gammaproteobacteria bacterium]